MINSISGTLLYKTQQEVTLQLPSISFSIATYNTDLLVVGNEYTFFMYMAWNQDTGPMFYGFSTPADRALFHLIIQCSGIGPKIGLNMIKELGASLCVTKIKAKDAAGIAAAVSGIGIKKAEHLLIALQDKIDAYCKEYGDQLYGSQEGVAVLERNHTIDLVMQTLKSLNYQQREIYAACKGLDAKLPFDVLIRQALQALSK